MIFINTLILSLTICIDSFILCTFIKCNKKSNYFIIPLIFTIFQTSLLLLGYFIGNALEELVFPYIKYIIFLIFSFMGIKMIIDTLLNKTLYREENTGFTLKNTSIQALISSFDSLFLGLPLSFNSESYFLFILIVSFTTFLFCFLGLLLRKRTSNDLSDKISIAGSIILFIFAFKSLL